MPIVTAGSPTTFLFLSSGARQRYLEDVFRALALPPGGDIRFRYRQDLVPADVADELLSAKGAHVYLCYLDIATPGVPPTFVPVRCAQIESVNKRGTSFFIYMQVNEYVAVHAAANLRQLVKDEIPKWGPREAAGTYPLEGCLVLRLKAELSTELLAQADDPVAFENTVDELLTHKDFSRPENRFFYQVVGLKQYNARNKLKSKFEDINDGAYELGANKRYQLQVSYRYTDEETPEGRPSHWLGIRTTGVGATVKGQGLQKSDSAYDIRSFRIQAEDVLIGADDEIEIFRTLDPTNTRDVHADIHINLHTKQSASTIALKVVAVGLAIALPAYSTMLPVDSGDRIAAIGFSALVSSGLAFYGLRKPY